MLVTIGCNGTLVAEAGDSATVFTGSTVTLDGRGSRDPGGGALRYEWTQTAGPGVVLTASADGTATFVAPDSPAELGFTLAVSSPFAKQTDSVAVHVVRLSVGGDQTVPRRSHVTLSGSVSDERGNPSSAPLAYRWQQTAGPTVELRDPARISTTFFAPGAECDLTFVLTATSGARTVSASTTVHVRNFAPVIESLSISPGSPRTLDDLVLTVGVTDADKDPLAVSYAWKRNGTAIAGQVAATLPNAETTRDDVITGVMTVSDGTATTIGEVSVTILDTLPILSADAPQSVAPCSPVAFHVTGFDPDGEPVGGLELDYGPAGMQVSPSGEATWPACQPMFEDTLDVNWSVRSVAHPEDRIGGTIRLSDPGRPSAMRRSSVWPPERQSGLLVTDLDGDGADEALVAGAHTDTGSNSLIEVRRFGGGYTERWDYPFYPGMGRDFIEGIAARDIDGDGRQEVFFSSWGAVVRLDGARHIAAWAGSGYPYGCVALDAADLEGDGTYELVCLAALWPEGIGRIIVRDAVTLQPEWESVDAPVGASLAVGNVDGDSALEIVTAGGYVIDGATHVEEWVQEGGFGTLVDTGDVDGDGRDEIIGATSGTLKGYDAEATSVLWEVARPGITALRVADLDADGRSEILAGDAALIGGSSRVAGFRYESSSGTLATLFETSSQGAEVSGIDVGDVDGDGAKELVWGVGGTERGGRLVIAGWNPDLGIEWMNPAPAFLEGPFVGGGLARLSPTRRALVFATASWDLDAAGGVRLVALDPATGVSTLSSRVATSSGGWFAVDPVDYDLDGVDEIFFAGSAFDGRGFFAAYDFAADRPEWMSPFVEGTGAAIAHADLNGDSFPDLVVVTREPAFVYAYDVKNDALIWKSEHLPGSGAQIAVADFEADGAPEIVVATSFQLSVFERAAAGPGYVQRAAVDFGENNALAVGDCDGDSTPEIYVASYWHRYVWQFDADLVQRRQYAVSQTVKAAAIEDLGYSRKNLVLALDYWSQARPALIGLDPGTGAEIWRSPELWGAVWGYFGAQGLHYGDVDGDGEQELSFGTHDGMYVTR